MNRIVVDEITYTGAGPFTVNTQAIRQAAETPVPGHPDKVWGLESIVLDTVNTLPTTMAGQAGATPGKRTQEVLDRMEIQLNGQDEPSCYAGGRALAELSRLKRGKVVFPAPTDYADADATVTPRYIHEFSWRDERLEDPEEPIPHAASLRFIKLTWNTAIVAGVGFTSVAVVVRAVLVPIERGKIPMAISFREEALGNGLASQTRADLPPRDGVMDAFFYFTGVQTGTGNRCQFAEAARITAEWGGRRLIDDQLIQSLIEAFDMRGTTDAAGEESATAPEFLHLVLAPFRQAKASLMVQAPQGGLVRSNVTMSDAGNVATAVFMGCYYGVGKGLYVESAAERAYLTGIKATHFPQATAFATRPKTLNGKASVPKRIAHLVARIATPVASTGG